MDGYGRSKDTVDDGGNPGLAREIRRFIGNGNDLAILIAQDVLTRTFASVAAARNKQPVTAGVKASDGDEVPGVIGVGVMVVLAQRR